MSLSDDIIEIKTSTPSETYDLGEIIGSLLGYNNKMLILLAGDLGTGKTLLTKGIASALAYDGDVTSPTFNLINEYLGETTIYHMDLYRLDETEQLLDLGFTEYLEYDGIVIIEWPEISFPLLSKDFLFINIEKICVNERKFLFRGEGETANNFLERLSKYVSTGN